MRKTLLIARRELAGFFVSPMAYVIGALLMLACNFAFFQTIFIPGKEATLRPLFEAMAYLMIVAVPLLTMKLVSEEFNSGTIEALMTAPVTDTQVILGKYLGVAAFYLAMLGVTLVPIVLMAIFSTPDWGIVIMGYLGMVFLGGAYLAVGLFTSTTSRYQLVAAIVGGALLAVFVFGPKTLVAYGPVPANTLAAQMDIMGYFQDFARGILDTRGVVFFASVTGVFLFLSIKLLESRRWR
jgi:ABC-2 type transport system permease protein